MTPHRKPKSVGWLIAAPGGFEPRDESPFGVLDMAGSRREWMRDAVPAMTPPTYFQRGGFWGRPEEEHFRTASRLYANGERADGDTGFRLIALRRE